MLKFTIFLTTLLLLFACNSQDNFKSSSSEGSSNRSSPRPNQFSTNTAFPEIECQGQLPKSLRTKLGSYRLAKESDFVSSIRSYAQENPTKKLICSIFGTDFNQDNLNDYALLLVAEDGTHFRFLILLNQSKGELVEALIRDYQSITQPSEGIIYTSMSYKPPGEPGITQREYSPIKTDTPEEEEFIASPAIELWDAIKNNQANIPQDLELATLAYCSQVFYWVENQLKTVAVCD